METRSQAASEAALGGSCGLRTRSSKRSVTERERAAQAASKRPRQSDNSKRKRKMDTSSDRDDGSSEPAAAPPYGASQHPSGGAAEASSSAGASGNDAAPLLSFSERRQAALEAAEQEALDMLDESATRARAGQEWGGPSNALQGLLRKLGAGLDDLLPSASSSHGRLKTILASLRGSDEGMQLASLSELCEMLSIGTEESMSALSVDAFTPLLIGMLRAEHNPDLMLLASRALCHMMDAIPSSSAAIVHFDGVPLFCERLLSIEYIDLAEQALHALEKLSQEHPLAVLRAGGMLAVLQYVDFFAMGVQRRAVATAANMCRGLPVECAHLVADSVPLLSNMLNHHDQKLVENACLAFNRLAESFAHSPGQLEMLAAQGLLPNLLRLVGGMVQGASVQSDAPVQLSDAIYTMLLRALATLCRGSPLLCKQLLQLDASSTLHDILAADSAGGDAIAAAVSRPHDQLYQILSLAHELLPPLPKAPAVGAAAPAAAAKPAAAVPKRRSKRGSTAQDAEGSEEEQAAAEGSSSASVLDKPPTVREQALLDEPVLVELYAQRLFALFMLVHSGAVNASVRSKSLSCMAKVLHFYPTTGLREMVRQHSIAAFLAPLLSMQDPATAAMALTMADILMTKLPTIYTDMFLREGVFDAIANLAATAKTLASAPAAAGSNAASAKAPTPAPAPAPSLPLRRTSRGRLSEGESPGASSGSSTVLPSDAARRRSSSGSSSRGAESAELADAAAPAAAAGAMAPPAPRAPHASPAAAVMAAEAAVHVASRAAKFNEAFVAVDPTLAAAVVSGEGSETLQKLRGLASAVSDPSLYSTLNRKVPLAGAWTAYADVHALRQLACLLDDLSAMSGVSTFELSKSGLVEGLLAYLTASKGEADDADAADRRLVRLRVFCTVFLGLPPPSLLSPAALRKGAPAPPTSLVADRPAGSPPALGALIIKLQDVLNMVERFPLALNESSSSDSNSHGLKALTQPFKLRLTRVAGEAASLKEYAANVVLIEPLATIGAVEEFLWPKVRRSQARASHGSERDAEEEEEEEEEEEDAPAALGSASASSAASSGGALASAPAAGGGSSGSTGKAPLRSTDQPFPMPPAGSARLSGKSKEGGSRGAAPIGRVGVVLSGFGAAVRGDADDEEEDPMDEDEEGEDDEDDEEGSLVGSPAFGASLDGGECVHDMQLNSPVRRGDLARSLGSYVLPPVGAAASRNAGSSRGIAGSSTAADAGRCSPNAAPSPKAADVSGTSPLVDGSVRPAGGGAAASPGGIAEVAPVPSAAAPEERQQKLVLLLNGRALPCGMSIFQAIRQSGAGTPASSTSGVVPSSVSASLSQRMWGSVYTLQYRLATPADLALVSASGDAGADASVLVDRGPAEAEAGRDARVLTVDANPLDGPLGIAAPPMAADAGESATPVLQLLWFLHRLNEHWSCIFSPAELAEAAHPRGPALPPSVFFNSKLNAKLMRQLQDPLALCSRSFPSWCNALTSACHFLFSFESRRLYLHSTAFGLSRALLRMQAHASEGGAGGANGSGEPRPEARLGRLPRQKVRISRSRVIDSAIKVMDLYASQKALLEVEYFGEVGTGLGPTLEFYALVSHELRKAELNLWHHEEVPKEATVDVEAEAGGADSERSREKLVHAPCGLFPRPVAQTADGAGVPKRTLQLFTFMGRFIAKAMLDSRLVDLTFAPPFYRHLLEAELGMDDLSELSPHLARSLGQLGAIARERTRLLATCDSGRSASDVAEDVANFTLHGCPIDQLGLDFTLPGFPEIELVPGGKDKEVNIDNLGEYVQLVLRNMLYDGVRAQIAAFKRGFSEVFGVRRLACFSPAELDVLFNGARERWDKAVVIEQIKFDHGYTRSSRAVGLLLDVLSEFTDAQLATFLKVRAPLRSPTAQAFTALPHRRTASPLYHHH
mmetsp:Transcript_12243/g.39389  ORF Transcript_12243/g.39389 Transcript_12243/m.39389 type:complete len:1911 (-) Transcript_12243:1069-6801(-)